MAVTPLTSAEEEAVKQFKTKLNQIKQEANIPETYNLWDIALQEDSTDPRLDILLVKFLRARDLDLTKASQMLKNMLIWRKDFRADELLDEAIDDSVLGSVSYIYKQDKYGRPVCYNFYGDIDQEKVFSDVQKFIRWRVQVMERGVQLIDFVNTDAMVVIHDYKNASLFGRTQNAKAATKEIIKIMQDNYPEFLAIKFFVNVPSWGSMIFKLIRPLLSEATTKKFVVCSNNELYQTLTNTIEAKNLPVVYQKADHKDTTTKLTAEVSKAKEPQEEEEQKVEPVIGPKDANADIKVEPENSGIENAEPSAVAVAVAIEDITSDKPTEANIETKDESNKVTDKPEDNSNTIPEQKIDFSDVTNTINTNAEEGTSATTTNNDAKTDPL